MTDRVRELRHQLISSGLHAHVPADDLVPDVIMRSWRRSLSVQVPIDVPCERYDEIDPESVLCRAAMPVLDRWQDRLADTGITLLMSDRDGSILVRRTRDNGLRRRLDRANASEGFNFAEDTVGTNGLGTSLAERIPVFVAGSQHFNDMLSGVTCAAAPVMSPSGAVLGSVSMSTFSESANELMLALTREVGLQIEERLRSTAKPQDLSLAMSFLRYRSSELPVMVLDQDSLLANTPAVPHIGVNAHVLLWEQLSDHDWASGRPARVSYGASRSEATAFRVVSGSQVHYVVHLSESAAASSDSTREPVRLRPSVSHAPPVRTPHLVGCSLADGPAGSGKAHAALAHHSLDGVVSVTAGPSMAWNAVEELLASGSHVLVRRVDTVPIRDADRLARVVADHSRQVAAGERTTLLLLTAHLDAAPSAIAAAVSGVPVDVVTQPLAEYPDDIPALVEDLLFTLDPEGRRALSAAAMQALMQWSWPGNVTELVDLLTTVVREVPDAVIQRRQLPLHLQQPPPRRNLSMIEAAERDTIIKAMAASRGNKSEAAELLGIGRTTLYRRLKHYRLDGGEAMG